MFSISLLAGLGSAWAQESAELAPAWRLADQHSLQPPALLAGDRDALGLPGLRPRLTMNLAGREDGPATSRSAFSWSLEAWQLNTASLAHIQCNRHTTTVDAFLAEDCRFVDQPIPEDSVNLVQVRGEWTAKPGLRLGIGAFHGSGERLPALAQSQSLLQYAGLNGGGLIGQPPQAVDGLDVNLSFGISSERVGDFLVGLQLARYRQRMSLSDLGFAGPGLSLTELPLADDYSHYANSAQLALGWRRGNFSGDLLGQHHRDAPMWLGNQPGSLAPYNSFDLEFSWRPRNASLSIGISNLLDAAPRGEDADGGHEDPLEQIFGRIPYVRYKHDL
ncbi:MAG: hypothetical protein EA370_04125 [Wenzhouxiangella sp.]|nr:MAG: hypothetical protein EA370_04125 [Wenzhouxiangella sp.]